MERAANLLRTGARKLAGALASVIFPAPCRVCGELLENANCIPFCESCLSVLSPIAEPMCAHCGRPFVSPVMLDGTSRPLCGLCRKNLYDFDFARSFAVYTPKVASAILLLKYEELAPLGRLFARHLLKLLQNHSEQFAADVIVPVPLHPARFRERGHNQADLIARPLARRLGLPCRS